MLERSQLSKPPLFDLSGIQGTNPLRDIKGKGKVRAESRPSVEQNETSALYVVSHDSASLSLRRLTTKIFGYGLIPMSRVLKCVALLS